MIRCFVAIELPRDVRHRIAQLIDEFEKGDYPVRWVSEENLHLTLKFLGEIPAKLVADVVKRLETVREEFSLFSLSLKGIGGFPTQHSPRVIWLGVDQGKAQLLQIQRRVEEALLEIGCKPEERTFHPHLTIGRVKGRADFEALFKVQYHSKEFRVDALTLFKSTLTPSGPIYERIGKFPLGNG